MFDDLQCFQTTPLTNGACGAHPLLVGGCTGWLRVISVHRGWEARSGQQVNSRPFPQVE